MAETRRTQKGDKISFRATRINNWDDAATQVLGGGAIADKTTQLSHRQADVITVKNASGGDLNMFSILAYSDPLVDPVSSETNYKNKVAATATTAVTADLQAGSCCILLQPLKSGAVGRAVVSGVVQCKVKVEQLHHRWCDFEAGTAARMISGDSGSARLLNHEATVAGSEAWAYVLLGERTTFFAEIDTNNGDGTYTFSSVFSDATGIAYATRAGALTGTMRELHGFANSLVDSRVEVYPVGDVSGMKYEFRGTRPGDIFAVDCAKDGGTDGDGSTVPSWIYTAKTTTDAISLGTLLAPKNKRVNGETHHATFGSGYYTAAGVFVLGLVNEEPNIGDCDE